MHSPGTLHLVLNTLPLDYQELKGNRVFSIWIDNLISPLDSWQGIKILYKAHGGRPSPTSFLITVKSFWEFINKLIEIFQ